ncbi:MAG: InlB B-repeat-containing protein, partial [Clostridia bacterium]|nr:InlB B-repeat-containing protein [Clostridia bacterium]
KDYNNEVLKTESVEYGVTPSFGTNPTRDATAEYTYTFKGWTPNLETVTKDAIYTATYTETKNTYTIKFIVNGQVAQQETLAYGTAISYKQTTPTKAPTSEYTYTFSGWALTENGEVVDSLGTVSGDITLYAIFTATQIPVSSSSSSTPSSSSSSTKPSSSSKVESSSSSNAPSSSSSNEIISSENSSYSKEESSISSAISSSSTQNNSSSAPISSNSARPTTRPTSGGCGANFGSTLSIISLLLVVGSIVFITKKKRN